MKIGFIGIGNIAGAIIGALIKKEIFAPEDILGSDAFEGARKKAAAKGITVCRSNTETAQQADILVLSIKPQFYEDVIGEIKDSVNDRKIIITIAPGKTIEWVTDKFGKELKIVRCMPNTPALVLEGCTAVCPNKKVTEEDTALVMKILNSFGKASIVPENLMDVVVGVSSSSPAYVFMFIEALADAAVAEGMPRAQSYEFAAQAVLGSAKMVLELGRHPGELKDMVCSPGGTTIQAVRALEERGMRASIMNATIACIEKSRSM